jgi:vacuolar-type H+-ATPase subunit E/Vma4
MAGEVPPLNVEILVQLSNLTAAVQEATAGLNKIGDTAKEQESKFSRLKDTMLGVFAGNLMTKGTEMLVSGLHEAVRAVEDTQVATEQLSTALNNAKQNTAANREEITKTTEKMSNLGFSVKDSETAYSKLITATGSTTESTKLMALAADLARYKHESLADAAATLEKGTMGNAKAFKEFGITLDAHLPKNEAIAKAMDQLNQKIGGQAVGYTHTFAGEMEILKAKFDDVAVKVGAVVMPILTKLLGFITGVLIPGIVFLYNVTIGAWLKELINLWNTHEGLRKTIVGFVEVVVKAYGYLLGIIAKVVDTVAKIPVLGSPFKALGKGIDEAAVAVGKFGSGLDGLANKKIKLPDLGSALATSGTTGAGGGAGVEGGLGAAGDVVKGAAAKAQAELKKRNAEVKKYNDELIKLDGDVQTVLKDRQDQMDKAREAAGKANVKIEEENAKAKADIQKKYADQATAIEKAAADKRQSIIQKSIDLMTSTFESATKIDLGSIFTAGGGTAQGIVTGLKDQLAKILKLQKDAGDLAAQGYTQTFIDQVIAKGPEVGDQMAQAVLNATPDTANQIKSLFGQIDDVSQTGLDKLANSMVNGTHLATVAMAREYAQVGVDMQESLADNQAKLTADLADQQTKYQKALNDVQQALDDNLKSISKSMDDKLTALQAKIKSATDALYALNAIPFSASTYNAATAALGGTQTTPYNMGGIQNGVYSTPNISIQQNFGAPTVDPATIQHTAVGAIKYATSYTSARGAGFNFSL